MVNGELDGSCHFNFNGCKIIKLNITVLVCSNLNNSTKVATKLLQTQRSCFQNTEQATNSSNKTKLKLNQLTQYLSYSHKINITKLNVSLQMEAEKSNKDLSTLVTKSGIYELSFKELVRGEAVSRLYFNH